MMDRRSAAVVAPWVTEPYKLVSLKEIFMPRPVDAEGYPTDEIYFGRFLNLFYLIGMLDGVRSSPTQTDMIAMGVHANLAAKDLERWGFYVTSRVVRDFAQMVEGGAIINNLPVQAAMVRQSLATELETRTFVPVAADRARFYRDPMKDWEEATERFPETITDIEESSRCLALGLYTACVFHSIQVVEHGLIALGQFMKLEDPKSGFTAVANGLQRIKDTKYPDLDDFERKHFAFFEQMHGSVHAMKDAWRNKVTHAQGKIVLMTSDFGPKVSEEIYMATRGFMRRLATEMPTERGLFK